MPLGRPVLLSVSVRVPSVMIRPVFSVGSPGWRPRYHSSRPMPRLAMCAIVLVSCQTCFSQGQGALTVHLLPNPCECGCVPLASMGWGPHTHPSGPPMPIWSSVPEFVRDAIARLVEATRRPSRGSHPLRQLRLLRDSNTYQGGPVPQSPKNSLPSGWVHDTMGPAAMMDDICAASALVRRASRE